MTLLISIARSDEPMAIDAPAAADVDAAVLATLPELSALERGDPQATTLVLATRFDTSVAALGDAVRPPAPPLVAPTRKPPTSVSARPIHVEKAAINAPASQLQILHDQKILIHADGLPPPNAASGDPLERVLPRAVDPNSVSVGARWDASERVRTAVLPPIALDAQADVLAGPAAPGWTGVRRTWRIDAEWNARGQLQVGLSPGVQHDCGGGLLEHRVTSLHASTLDPTWSARWRGFVELSGDRIAPNNIIENASAHVRAGASYQPASGPQVDVSVARGTMYRPDTQSSVDLSLKF